MPVAIVFGTDRDIREGRGNTVLTSAQACARVGISSARLSQLVAKGALRQIGRLGKSALYLEDDVEELRKTRGVG